MKKLAAVLLLLLARPAEAAVEGSWTSIGPQGGNAMSLAVAPDHVVWAGMGRNGGLYRSIDGGISWRKTGGELGSQSILTVAVDPVRPKLVYAGTWNGLFRSIDGGRTWAPSNQGLPSYDGRPAEVRALAVDPRAPRRIFALSGAGLYLSRNQGRSWELSLQSGLREFAIAPSEPRVLYTLESFGKGHRSTDGGLTWTPMDLGSDGYDAFRLAVHPTDPEIVWAAVATRFNNSPALLRSLDGGRTWEPIRIYRKITTLLADPREPDTLWAGVEGGILRIFDRGARWRFFPVSGGEDVLSLAFDPTDRQSLYAGTGWNETSSRGFPGRQGGVWRSGDRGRTWQQAVRGLIATEISAVVVPAPGRIVAAVLGRGPMLGSGDLSDWALGAQGVEREIHDLLADPADPDRLWAATPNGVFRSEDGGRTWAWSSEGLAGGPFLPSSIFINALALDPSGSRLWAAGWGGLFQSADRGRTWSRVATLPDRSLQSMAVDPRDGRKIWVASSGGGPTLPSVLRSEDGGTAWQETSFLSYSIGPVVVGPTGTVLVSTLGQIARSTDGGATWQEADLGGVFSIAPDPADADTVWAAGIFGLHRSQDGGATWEAVTGGPVPVVFDLQWEAPGRLLLATQGAGLFRFVPND